MASFPWVEQPGSIVLGAVSPQEETVSTDPVVSLDLPRQTRQVRELRRIAAMMDKILRAHGFGENIEASFTTVAATLRSAWKNAIESVFSYEAWRAVWQLAGKAPPVDGASDRFIAPLWVQYDVRSVATVKAFLFDNPAVVDALGSAITHIDKVLHPVAKPSLDVTVFFDEDDDQELTVLIPIDCDAAEAMARLAEFDDTWWLDQRDDVRRLITFDVDFR